MNLLDFGNRPAAWVLQQWCDNYLALPPDAAFAVQLSNGTAHLRDVALRTEPFNDQLGRFGLKLTQGHVSHAEFIVQEWSRLKVCVELDTLSLLIRSTQPSAPATETGSSESLLRLVPVHVLVKWFMTNLKIRIRRLIMHFEAGNDCMMQFDLHGVTYERTTDEEKPFNVKARSVELSLTDPSSRESTIHRLLTVERMSTLMGTQSDDRLHLDLRLGCVRSEMHPEVCVQTSRLLGHLRRQFLDAGGDLDNVFDEAASMVESVFYDAESLSRCSSVHSDLTESAFFDCEEQPNVPTQPISSFKRSIVFDCRLDRLDVVLQSTENRQDIGAHCLSFESMDCQGVLGEDTTVEASLGHLSLTDRSPDSALAIDRSARCVLPEALQSIIQSTGDGETSYIRLGSNQSLEHPCLSLRVQQTSMGWQLKIQSQPIVAWSSCASLQRLYRLLQSYKGNPSIPQNTTVPSMPPLTLDWEMPSIFWALEFPKTDDGLIPGLLFLEAKSETGMPFVTVKQSREIRRWQESMPVQSCIITCSLFECCLHHCPLEAGIIADSRCIVSCIPQPGDQLSTGNAATLEITQSMGHRPSVHNLSSLAYGLIDVYDQQHEEGFKERTLSHVEYDGKCIRSADAVVELLLGCVRVDMRMDDIGACMDAVLDIWRPSQMADQLKTCHQRQTVAIVKAQKVEARLKPNQDGSCEEAADGIELHGNELQIVGVGGVQCKTISTLSVAVGCLIAQSIDRRQRCHIGMQEDLDGSSIQFFHISELDYRNAKFKQWTSLQHRKMRLEGDNGVFDLNWIRSSLERFLVKNMERIQTDIEVEQCLTMVLHDIWIQYNAPDLPSIVCALERAHANVKNNSKASIDIIALDVLMEYEGQHLKRWLHEDRLNGFFRREQDENEIEITNEKAVVHLSPDLLSDLCTFVRTLPIVEPSDQATPHTSDAFQGSTRNLLDAISNDAFAVSRSTASINDNLQRRQASLDEDEDGFVMIDTESGIDAARTSHAEWLDTSAIHLRDDYIHIPHQEYADDLRRGQSTSHAGRHTIHWVIKFQDCSVECDLAGLESGDRVIVSADGINIAYSKFRPGSVYCSRWSASVQELEVVDRRRSVEEKRILERLRSQLKTACSRRLKQQKTMTFPLLQLTLETVLPDAIGYATVQEKRCQLTILPLRLRISHCLSELCKRYLDAIPSSNAASRDDCFIQMCTVSAFYIHLDYRPRQVNLDRLRAGRPGELINMVQWEGMEFFLNEIKTVGIHGWDHLLGHIVENWTYDISHAQRHMVAGFPALAMVRRMSPAAQDVARAAMSTLKRSQLTEEDVRGARLTSSLTLSRAITELGRVFSLEVLNLCAHGTEGMHLVFDGTDGPPAPINAREGLHQAKDTLRAAARSVVADPIRSARSGEGVGMAMTKALWAVPKALLAPASAATTVLHGTLKSACDALDTDKVLNL